MSARRGWGLVIGSFVVALALELLPLPTWAEPARPAWIAAVLLWWCLHAPQRANVDDRKLWQPCLHALRASPGATSWNETSGRAST